MARWCDPGHGRRVPVGPSTTQMPSRPARRLASLLARVAALSALALPACTAVQANDDTTAADSMVALAKARLDSLAATDSQVSSISFAVKPRGRTLGAPLRSWGVMEDTMLRFTVFAPATQTSYLAAVRAKRLLVDIGRVDLDMKEKPARLASLRKVAAQLSPVAPGARFRLHHAHGSEEATVTGYDVWNGRLVATLAVSPTLDSVARTTPALVAAAELLQSDSTGVAPAPRDTAAAPDTVAAVAGCVRDSVPPALLVRADSVRDSLLVELAKKPIRIPRLAKMARSYSAKVPGCFGPARMLVAASIRAGAYEYTSERVVMLDSTGRATPLAVRDYRFRVHDDLRALDADGDGMDDVAALGSGRGVGGTTILRLDAKGKVLERVANGFGFDRAQ